jgi:5'-phosphate synthase pdxT subunit
VMAASAGRVRAAVLALQGDVAEHVVALREAGAAEVREVRRPEDLEGVDALAIPGGESTTIGRLMVEYGIDEAIRRRVADGMAVFGTCAGMILLCTDIVGSDQPRLGLLPARVRRNAYGRQVDSFETRLEVPAISPVPIEAVFIRAPWIESVEAGVRVLARHEGRIVLCQKDRILAASFHPELTPDRRLHRYFLGLVRQA